jgi:hypothetical protein
MKELWIILAVLAFIFLVCAMSKGGLCGKKGDTSERFSSGGFGTITGLAYNNTARYYIPPSADGAFSGGEFSVGPVLF